MSNKLQKILLVYPEIPSNTYWSFKYALKFLKKKSAMPPLGLITVAGLIPKTCDLKLIDMNIESLDDKDLQWADAIFISAMVVQKQSFNDVVLRANQFNKTVVAGGPYITVCHDQISGVDHFLLGEVEETLSVFMNDFEQGTAKKLYPASSFPDISKTISPRFDLLSMNAYSCMSIQYSRGCPFNCEFCDIWQIYGRTPRIKNPETMLAELDTLKKLGWSGAVFMVDDNFIGNKTKVKQDLLPALIAWQKNHKHIFRFFTEASLNLADDDELLVGMRDAAFNSVFLGIETPCVDSLQETGKMQNTKTNMIDAVKKIQSYAIEVMGGFIIGFDNDTPNIFEQQIKFIEEAAIPKAMVGLLNAIPGTKLYQRLKDENRILADDISGSNTHALNTNFITTMDPQKLKEGYSALLNYLYGMKLRNYFKRSNTLLDQLGYSPFFVRDVRWYEISIFIRAFWRQTFSLYGYHYIKFLIRNTIKHPKIFGETVRIAIEGHHFYMITSQTLKANRLSNLLEKKYQYVSKKINDFSITFSSNSNKKMKELAKLWKIKKENFDALKEKIQQMPAEFQKDIIVKYNKMDRELRVLFDQYKELLWDTNKIRR